MTKRIIALSLTALALAGLIFCGFNAVSLITDYQQLSAQTASGFEYLGVVVGFGLQCAAAFTGCVLSLIALFVADRRWIKWIAGIFIVLLVASVLVVFSFR